MGRDAGVCVPVCCACFMCCVSHVVYVVLCVCCVCVSERCRRSHLLCSACSVKWEASSFDDDEGGGKQVGEWGVLEGPLRGRKR